jgi:hypothetical protein
LVDKGCVVDDGGKFLCSTKAIAGRESWTRQKEWGDIRWIYIYVRPDWDVIRSCAEPFNGHLPRNPLAQLPCWLKLEEATCGNCELGTYVECIDTKDGTGVDLKISDVWENHEKVRERVEREWKENTGCRLFLSSRRPLRCRSIYQSIWIRYLCSKHTHGKAPVLLVKPNLQPNPVSRGQPVG